MGQEVSVLDTVLSQADIAVHTTNAQSNRYYELHVLINIVVIR